MDILDKLIFNTKKMILQVFIKIMYTRFVYV